jgi:hypothetical protein
MRHTICILGSNLRVSEEKNMSFVFKRSNLSRLFSMMILPLATLGCTQSGPRQFQSMRADDSVASGAEFIQEVVSKHTTPVDMLWVIDNSASMGPSQDKLRTAFAKFAKQYLRAGTDIQLAVITTDFFVANDMWQKYLDTPLSHGKSPSELNPAWGPKYANLDANDIMKTKNLRDSSSVDGLIARFKTRADVGTKGIYEEEGFGSVYEMIEKNERKGSNKLFRPNSQRIIIFLSDENDQTIDLKKLDQSQPQKLLYSKSYYVGKDPVTAEKMLPAHFTINCPTSVVEGKTLEPMSICMKPEYLEPVSSFKAKVDEFFRELDGSPSGNPNYFVASIVGINLSTIEALRRLVTTEITHERGDRYLELVNMVGNGSFAMDIGARDYSKILEKIGLEIEERTIKHDFKARTSFEIERAVNTEEPVFVVIIRADQSVVTLTPEQYRITKNQVQLIDKKFNSTLKPGDRIRVNYHPASVLPANQTQSLL